jgi:hypothetical protein
MHLCVCVVCTCLCVHVAACVSCLISTTHLSGISEPVTQGWSATRALAEASSTYLHQLTPSALLPACHALTHHSSSLRDLASQWGRTPLRPFISVHQLPLLLVSPPLPVKRTPEPVAFLLMTLSWHCLSCRKSRHFALCPAPAAPSFSLSYTPANFWAIPNNSHPCWAWAQMSPFSWTSSPSNSCHLSPFLILSDPAETLSPLEVILPSCWL